MDMTLFDFDFETSEEELYSEEKIREQFEILQDISKEMMNGYYIDPNNIPRDMLKYIEKFKENNWIEMREGGGFYILDEFVKFHTTEELINGYEEILWKAISKPDVSYYDNVLPLINSACSPIRYESDKQREIVYKKKQLIVKDIVTELGLNHFLNVPSARGMKMKMFNSKWIKEHVLPMVIDIVKDIDDYDEMEYFFRNNTFFFGRRDWNWGYNDIAPYPEYKQILTSPLEIAALSEATEDKDIKLILEYVGNASGGSFYSPQDAIYPDGWSFERYEETLTEEDKQLIKEDEERLKRLHG